MRRKYLKRHELDQASDDAIAEGKEDYISDLTPEGDEQKMDGDDEIVEAEFFIVNTGDEIIEDDCLVVAAIIIDRVDHGRYVCTDLCQAKQPAKSPQYPSHGSGRSQHTLFSPDQRTGRACADPRMIAFMKITLRPSRYAISRSGVAMGDRNAKACSGARSCWARKPRASTVASSL